MVFRGTETNAKTVLCTRFQSPEGCRFGDRCNFAHGSVEIRPRPDGPPGTGVPARAGVARPAYADEGMYNRGQPTMRGGVWGTGGEEAPLAGQQFNSNGWAAAVGGGAKPGGNAYITGAEVMPQAALRAVEREPGNHGWTQHTAPEGYCYYYNAHTGVSQWERPIALDFPITSAPALRR